MLTLIKLFFLRLRIKRMEQRDLLRPSDSDRQHSLGLLIDLDQFSVPSVVNQLTEAFGIPKERIHVLGFSMTQVNVNFPSFVMGSHLSWFAGEISEAVMSFKQKPYRYLLNFHRSTHPVVIAINQETRATFKMGIDKDQECQLDFILNSTHIASKDIISQLGSYVQKISL